MRREWRPASRTTPSAGSGESKRRSQQAKWGRVWPLYPVGHGCRAPAVTCISNSKQMVVTGEARHHEKGLYPARVWTRTLGGQSPGLAGQAFAKLKLAVSIRP